MRFDTANTTPAGFQPVSINLTLDNADDLRWFYHLMNFQMKEIKQGYAASSKGSFDSRFRGFEVPDKKDLYRFIKDQAAIQGVDLAVNPATVPAYAV